MLRQLGPQWSPASFQIWKKGKDSKKPSVWPIRTPLRPAEQSPPRSRVADLPSSGSLISASLEGSPQDPRPRKRISASLEDSGPALERVAKSPPRSRPSLGTRDKRPRRPTDHRTKALKASHFATAQRTGGVRLPGSGC